MPKCHYKSCERDADYLLAYTEDGTPRTEEPVCTEHKNTEQIHDPINTKVVEEYL